MNFSCRLAPNDRWMHLEDVSIDYVASMDYIMAIKSHTGVSYGIKHCEDGLHLYKMDYTNEDVGLITHYRIED